MRCAGWNDKRLRAIVLPLAALAAGLAVVAVLGVRLARPAFAGKLRLPAGGSPNGATLQALDQLPLYFVENQGQLDARVAYYVQGRDRTLYFTPDGVTFALSGEQRTTHDPRPLAAPERPPPSAAERRHARTTLRATPPPSASRRVPGRAGTRPERTAGESWGASPGRAEERTFDGNGWEPLAIYGRPSRPGNRTFHGHTPERRNARTPERLSGVAATPPHRRTPGQRWVVKLEFRGTNPDAGPVGEEQTDAVISYFKGPREEWHTGVPTYRRIVYRELWPGIDLVYEGTVHRLKYQFLVQAGADPAQIRLAYRGATAVRLTQEGRLAVTTPVGGFEDDVPVAYQEIGGKRIEVAATYALTPKEQGPGTKDQPLTPTRTGSASGRMTAAAPWSWIRCFSSMPVTSAARPGTRGGALPWTALAMPMSPAGRAHTRRPSR